MDDDVRYVDPLLLLPPSPGPGPTQFLKQKTNLLLGTKNWLMESNFFTIAEIPTYHLHLIYCINIIYVYIYIIDMYSISNARNISRACYALYFTTRSPVFPEQSRES